MTASSAQGTAFATVETASVGTAGRGTPARSGWEPSTEDPKGQLGASETRGTCKKPRPSW